MARDTFVRYGKATIPLRVPDGALILQAKTVPAIADPERAVREALDSPIGSEPLAALVAKKRPRTAVVTISDITRPVPNKLLLPPVLEILEANGVLRGDITILVATGMHRASTDAEKLEMVGENIVANYRILDHMSERREELVQMPRPTVHGTIAYVNRHYMEADFKIVTGFIEPHFMAGFSGGRKGVCPGLVNVETVQKFHGFHFLDSDKAANFSLEGNPLHEEATDVAAMAGIDFLLNVGLNENKELAAVFAGDWREAFFEGARVVKDWTSAIAERECDVVITCGGGYPLDKTLYQTGKGMCSALPILKKAGVAIVASECSEGLGSPSFSSIMKEWGNDWRGFVEWIRDKPDTTHDQWGFQMHAKVLERVGGAERLLFASGGIPAAQRAEMSLTPLGGNDVKSALQSFIDSLDPDCSLAVLPDGPYCVPVLATPALAGS